MASCQQGAEENTEEATDEVVNEEQDITNEETPQGQQGQMPGQPGMPEAATDVSDEELEEFAAISRELQGMRMEAQQEMMAAVQETGMDVQRFSQIQQAQQMPNQQSDATDAEMEQYNEALEQLESIQADIEEEMKAVIEEEGMSEERYQSIGMAIQSNPELMAKFREMQQPQTPGQPQMQQQGNPEAEG